MDEKLEIPSEAEIYTFFELLDLDTDEKRKKYLEMTPCPIEVSTFVSDNTTKL